jgi:hypothetical protein
MDFNMSQLPTLTDSIFNELPILTLSPVPVCIAMQHFNGPCNGWRVGGVLLLLNPLVDHRIFPIQIATFVS